MVSLASIRHREADNAQRQRFSRRRRSAGKPVRHVADLVDILPTRLTSLERAESI